MQPPQDSSSSSSGDSHAHRAVGEEVSDAEAFEQTLQQVEETLNAVKKRYQEITAARETRSELRAQYNRTQSELRQHRTRQLQSELKAIKKKLDEVEIILESQLFSWSRLKEPFWMAVSFGGLGVVIGWVLRAIAKN